jgi:hypothetical protein
MFDGIVRHGILMTVAVLILAVLNRILRFRYLPGNLGAVVHFTDGSGCAESWHDGTVR